MYANAKAVQHALPTHPLAGANTHIGKVVTQRGEGLGVLKCETVWLHATAVAAGVRQAHGCPADALI